MQEDCFNKNLGWILSEDRLRNYLYPPASYARLEPLALYKWNTALSESLYPSLQAVEVSFRNAMHHAITQIFGGEDWLLQGGLLQPQERERVQTARSHLIKNRKEPLIGRLIAELSFGFWTSLLDARYEHHLWRYIIKLVFPGLKKRIRTRKQASRRFEIIRKLRNRVFHYEPIWHFQDLECQYKQIIEVLQWLNHGAYELIDGIDRFSIIYGSGPGGLKNVT